MKRAILLVLVLVGRASAEDAWQKDVSADDQKKAEALFAEGNELFARDSHAPALDKYKAAIALWDHPLIRFNIAVTEIRLDRILEAADDLEAALRFGQAPFTRELYQQATDYQKLIGGRVGYLEASCEQAGGSVLLDGKPWFKCADKQKRRVLAGEHVIVAEADGYMPVTRRIVLAGGKTVSQRLVLLPLERVEKLEYPSPRWLPWTVTGVGAATILGGVAFYFVGGAQMDTFDSNYARMCPMGCTDDPATRDRLLAEHDRALLKGRIGLAMEIGGVAIAGAGIVWIILNRPNRVMPISELVPTTGGASVRVSWRF